MEDYQPDGKPPIRASIESLLRITDGFLNAFREGHREESIGEHHAGLVLFHIYCFRAFDSIQAAAILSTHGFFGETISVLRHLIEQIAWLTVTVQQPKADEIRRIRAEASLTNAKHIFPKIGDLYGVLSEASHFRPDHHTLHLEIEAGKLMTVRRSAQFSAYGFCSIAVCVPYLVNLVLGAINCQYTYEKPKFQPAITELHDSIIRYFESGTHDEFIARLLKATEPINPDFAPWPAPIFQSEI